MSFGCVLSREPPSTELVVLGILAPCALHGMGRVHGSSGCPDRGGVRRVK